MSFNQHEIRDTVRQGYAEIAKGTTGGCCATSSCCCGGSNASVDTYAEILGYASEEIQALPEGANMGLSCGNPTVLATLQPGEVVLDLGSGGGFDVFIAARRVGPTGRAIGVDMTPEMIAKARHNAETFRDRTGLNNVEFRLGEIEHLPVEDNSVDVVISNCVINLSPDKPQVWREIARVLKPGGRAAISDIALLRPLPESVTKMTEALIGCVAGAVALSDTTQMIQEAGLVIENVAAGSTFLDAVETTYGTALSNIEQNLPFGTSLRDFIASAEILAKKPGKTSCCCQ